MYAYLYAYFKMIFLFHLIQPLKSVGQRLVRRLTKADRFRHPWTNGRFFSKTFSRRLTKSRHSVILCGFAWPEQGAVFPLIELKEKKHYPLEKSERFFQRGLYTIALRITQAVACLFRYLLYRSPCTPPRTNLTAFIGPLGYPQVRPPHVACLTSPS